MTETPITRTSAHKGRVHLQGLQGPQPRHSHDHIPARDTQIAGDVVIRLIMRSRTLLPFEYTLTELLTELGVEQTHRKKFSEWCRASYPNPIPHTHDATGHLLVHGWAFRDWVRTQISGGRRRQRTRLPSGHLWCPGCNRPQLPLSETIDEVHGRRRLQAVCAAGHRMSQFIGRGAA